MTLNKMGLRAGTAVVAVAMLATACGGSSDDDKKGKDAGAKGGQLEVLMIGDFEHIDPQRNYVSSALNFGRLLYRQLTTYKSEAGTAGSELAPDLATDLGTSSDNAKTWKFTLKDGVKYEDGTPITSQDIKYGVERSMSPLIDSGPQYAKQYLVGGTEYSGPYAGKELASIETPDAKTIIFHLKAAHGDFPYTVSLPTFAPVPKAKDTKVNYDSRPFSSGPYKIDTYVRGKSMTLSRNTNWGQDTVRKALPDTVRVTFGLDANVIDQRIITSAGADANAIQIDTAIQAANVATVRSRPDVKARSVSGPTGFNRYIWMNTTKGPLKNVKVRQALEWAVNKTDQQTARGGPDAAGDIGTTILVPTVKGHKDFSVYAGPAGDSAKAKQLLADAGYPNGFKATFQTQTSPKGQAQAAAFQASMKKIGVTITIAAVDPGVYYSTIGDVKKQPEFGVAGWGPDWPAASTVIPPLFDGRQIVPTGNQNFSQLNEPKVNAEMDRIAALTDLDEAAKAWGDLDETIIKDYAPIFPLLVEKAIFIVGKNVKGAFMHSFYGEPDVSALGVA
ncbi:MAG TPA: ABC transporter substrate-binding protein [Mycobacteriales bacterium]|nr:ABC transporter substrate-binding protein [Mycobacteriales bacterium]